MDRYLKLLARHPGESSVQLGDFGIGFPGDEPLPPLPSNTWFLRGNHDNPEAARSHGNYLGDYCSKTIDGIRIFHLLGRPAATAKAESRGKDSPRTLGRGRIYLVSADSDLGSHSAIKLRFETKRSRALSHHLWLNAQRGVLVRLLLKLELA